MFDKWLLDYPRQALCLPATSDRRYVLLLNMFQTLQKSFLAIVFFLDSYIKTLLKTSKPSRFIRVNLFCLLLAYQTNKTDWKTI